MTTLTEQGNLALRLVIATTKHATYRGDDWDRAFLLGQISVIEGFMQPDPAVLAAAKAAVKPR